MANIKKTTTECQFFVKSDPYNFETDNRPLSNLLANDLLINAELEGVRNEVTDARTSLEVTVYESLVARLDAMENAIGTSVSIADVENLQEHQFSDFLSHSEAIRRTTPSGWLDQQGIADLSVGDVYDDFSGIRTTSSLGVGYENSVVIWTGWGSGNRPVRALVNGWVVPVYNEIGGTPPLATLNHITVGMGSAPSTGKYTNFVFLEVWLESVDKENPEFYLWGGVENQEVVPTTNTPTHPYVIPTVVAMEKGGNWVQLRHRIRVIQDIDPEAYPYGFESGVLARGSGSEPGIGTYTFSNMSEINGDAGLWRSGAGDNQSKTDLGTVDGYIYAIPMWLGHRRNSGNFSLSNQNGCKKDGVAASGYIASEVSGRPDGLYYDSINQRDILDLRSRVSLSGVNLGAELERTWQALCRGELRTSIKPVRYDYNNDGVWEDESVWGHTVLWVDEVSNTAEQHTNPLRDFEVDGQPLAFPDGQRTAWGRTPRVQPVKFSFTQGNSSSVLPAGFVTYDPATETLTFNAASLSGSGVGGTKIGVVPPVVMKKSDLGSRPSVNASGLGTQTTTVRMSSVSPAAEYVGYIFVLYPGGSGITHPHKRVLTHTVVDSGITPYDSSQFGVTGTPIHDDTGLAGPNSVAKLSNGNLVISDSANRRVVIVNPSTWSVIAQFGVTQVSGTDNTHLSYASSVAVDTSDNVYLTDINNHRVIKLNSSLVYISQFGVTAVPGADNTHLNRPIGVAADANNVWVTDYENHRMVKLTTSLAYVDQFGTTGVSGASKYGLRNPIGVARVSAGFGSGVWISDRGNRRIVVLNTDLQFQYQIGDRANYNALTRRYGTDVAIDSSGNFYISFKSSHVVIKYNQLFSEVARFGVDGSVGSSNSKLSSPGGLAVDSVRGWIYVADTGNHRVVRLNLSNLSYNSQFGITGVSSYQNKNQLCVSPSDVAVDDLGNVYITEHLVHVVTKINSSLVFVARFGVYGAPGGAVSTGQLRNPVGIGVKPDGSLVAVTDGTNKRIVMLDSNLAYVRHFSIVYDTTVTSLEVLNYFDIEWSPSESRWYLSALEGPRGTNAPGRLHTLFRFADNPGVSTPNYESRIEVKDYPTGMAINNTTIFTTTENLGLQIVDISNPTNVDYSSDPLVNIEFSFGAKLAGLSFSSGIVLVAEPNIHAVHAFDSTAGIYLGSAGVSGEPGDDDSRLNSPQHAIVDGEWMIVADNLNHRVLRRHLSSPWVSSDGTIYTMVPPVGADKIVIYYESDAYQGTLGLHDTYPASVFKSQVRQELKSLIASTLGLGSALSSQFSHLQHLHGMVTRLPLPKTWENTLVNPVGMKLGNDDTESPYLRLGVLSSEGLMGGQVNVMQEGSSILTSQLTAQQIVRTMANPWNPKKRGERSLLPSDRPTTRLNSINTTRFSPLYEQDQDREIRQVAILEEDFQEVLRFGTPFIRANSLEEAVPHLNYYALLFIKDGRLMMLVITEGSSGRNVSTGSYENNAVDIFFPQGRILIR